MAKQIQLPQAMAIIARDTVTSENRAVALKPSWIKRPIIDVNDIYKADKAGPEGVITAMVKKYINERDGDLDGRDLYWFFNWCLGWTQMTPQQQQASEVQVYVRGFDTIEDASQNVRNMMGMAN